MQDASAPGHGDPRWEYRILWRYGPLGLVVAGAALLAIGASGLCATAVSVTLLPIGLVCLLAGVVLPRIEGVSRPAPRASPPPCWLSISSTPIPSRGRPWRLPRLRPSLPGSLPGRSCWATSGMRSKSDLTWPTAFAISAQRRAGDTSKHLMAARSS